MRLALALVALATLAACAAPRLTGTGHPLAGRVWDVAAQRFVTPAEAGRRVAAADIAILGETHDNPVHHRIQRRLLERTTEAGRRPALAMEQIDTEWQAAVDRARAAGATPDSIGKAGHVARGWHWAYYEPLVAWALDHDLAIVAADLSPARARSIAERGLAALGAGEAERLALAASDSPAVRAGIRATLVEGHCGEDDPMIDKLVDVQRARDAVMADRILSAGASGTVAILGRGHARADLDVPLYLHARAPGLRVLSVALVEVDDDLVRPQDYRETAPGMHDLVWFTPAAERTDPCVAFRRTHPKAHLPAG